MSNRFNKVAAAVLDYKVDWTAWLADDIITDSAWDVPVGITKESDSFTSTSGTIWLSGGEVGKIYRINHHITTAAGRQDYRTIIISIVPIL